MQILKKKQTNHNTQLLVRIIIYVNLSLKTKVIRIAAKIQDIFSIVEITTIFFFSFVSIHHRIIQIYF